MKLKIQVYTEQFELKVREFNRRLEGNGISFQFPEKCISDRLPNIENRSLYENYFIAIEENTDVRGGYIQKHQDFIVNGKIKSIGNIQLPLSEGKINNKYNLVGFHLVNDALSRQPYLYALGMGGENKPFPKLLKSIGWNLVALPFYFKVIKPNSLLKNIIFLRTSKYKRILSDILRYTHLVWLLTTLWNKTFRVLNQNNSVRYEIVSDLDDWVDLIWEETKNRFSFSGIRTKDFLNILYPRTNKKLIRLKVYKMDQVIGWAIVLVTSMNNNKYFGNMRVGSIVDCLSLPSKSSQLISAVNSFFEYERADIIVSNQANLSYCKSLKKNGFIKGPSNFVFASSPKLTQILLSTDPNLSNIHINRGDGDGPMNL